MASFSSKILLRAVCRRVSLVKSDKDNRYALSAVVSHDGVHMPCVAVPTLAAFRKHVGEEEYRQVCITLLNLLLLRNTDTTLNETI